MSDHETPAVRALATGDLLIDQASRDAFKAERRAARRNLDGYPFVQIAGDVQVPRLVDVGRRRSERIFTSRAVAFADLSALLSVLAAEFSSSGSVRRYASAGSTYAVQVYLQAHGTRVEGLPQGAYYFDPERRRLVLLDTGLAVGLDDHFSANRPWIARGAFTVLAIADLSAIRPLYGERARDFCLVETGGMLQLLQSVAAGLGVGLCQSGVVDFDRVCAELQLGTDHEVLAAVVGGAVDRRRSGTARPDAASEIGRRPPAAPDGSVVPPPPPAPAPIEAPALPAPAARRPAVQTEAQRAIEAELLDLWKALLETDDLDPTALFFDVGATSIMAAHAVRTLQERYPDAGLDVADIFAFPSVRELACRLAGREDPRPASGGALEPFPAGADASRAEAGMPVSTSPARVAGTDTAIQATVQASSDARVPADLRVLPGDPREPVAIIGVAVRVSGASTPDEFWDLLVGGRCRVEAQPETRRALIPAFRARGGQVFTASYLSGIELFDPGFFHMSPREAERADPAQRLALEVAADLLASAGYGGGQLAGTRTGVYIGASRGTYAELRQEEAPDLTRLLSGNMGAIIANRISHVFDLAGPSIVVDTACSSSLVAVDQAVRALQSGDADAAIAGGVNLLISPEPFEAFRQDGMESPSGLCRTFDARADGFVRGEGAGAVLLKRLSDALRDGDYVYAVVRGSATNHDGRTSSLPVPSPIAQRKVIELAHRRANTTPAAIEYVEAHGTGTALGDPIEIRGLTDAYRGSPSGTACCAIGSVKTNLGHLEFAAGIVGLVKAALALERGALPPSLHLAEPNPHIDFAATPFWVVDRLRPWPARHTPRLAAVSSFGVGGTNAHVILEEAPAAAHRSPGGERPAHLIAVSAGDEASLAAAMTGLAQHVQRHPEIDIADLACTMNVGRPALPVRAALVARDRDQLIDRLTLAAFAQGRALPSGIVVRSVDVEPLLDPEIERRVRRLAACDEGWRSLAKDERLARLAPAHVSRPAPDGEERDAPDWHERLSVLGELWVRGFDVAREAIDDPAGRRRVPCPGLSYVRERCWWPAVTADSAAGVERLDAPGSSRESNRGRAERTGESVPRPAAASGGPSGGGAPGSASPDGSGRDQIVLALQARIGSALGIPRDRVQPRTPLVEMGLDSLAATELMNSLRISTGLDVDTTFFFEHPTVIQLAEALMVRGITSLPAVADAASRAPAPHAAPEPLPAPSEGAEPIPIAGPSQTRRRADLGTSSIAVVGMAGRLPGAPDLERFWTNLKEGVDAIAEVPRERFDVEALFEADPRSDRGTCGRWGGFLQDIDRFDPRFFRIPDREARSMDPQQRLLLMTAWHAVENAGLARRIVGSRTGVYVGASYTHHRDRLAQEGRRVQDAHAALDNHNAILANRISYFLDLHGPCLTIDTLCSSSLVALHAAVRALRQGEIDRAIVAGVNVALSASYYEAVSRLGALSPDGRCRTFDADANGYVPGEGVVALVLEPLERAVADRSHIHAVILGTAVNHGGQTAGLTVPNPTAQADVVRAALEDAGVAGESVSYVEAHGTGTPLGDPVEISGLRAALGAATTRRQFCGIGSLKSNIGHLEPAAGLASVVKVILSMQHRLLPPSLHVREPNRAITFEDGPCYVVDRLRPWPAAGPRRAGVSSFGLGGTNAHAVLEEAPPVPHAGDPAVRAWLFVASARDERALRILVDRYRDFMHAEPACSLPDFCFSATDGRAHFAHRVAIVADSLPSLQRQLAGVAAALKEGTAVPRPDGAETEHVLARAFLEGRDIDPSGLFPGARRIPLPLYPFEERRMDVQLEAIRREAHHPFAALLQPAAGASPGTTAYLVRLTDEGAA